MRSRSSWACTASAILMQREVKGTPLRAALRVVEMTSCSTMSAICSGVTLARYGPYRFCSESPVSDKNLSMNFSWMDSASWSIHRSTSRSAGFRLAALPSCSSDFLRLRYLLTCRATQCSSSQRSFCDGEKPSSARKPVASSAGAGPASSQMRLPSETPLESSPPLRGCRRVWTSSISQSCALGEKGANGEEGLCCCSEKLIMGMSRLGTAALHDGTSSLHSCSSCSRLYVCDLLCENLSEQQH